MPRKAVERAFAWGEIDTFPFVLARDLGWSIGQLEQLPHDEYLRWRAFYVWEQAMRDFKSRVAAARSRG